MILGRSSLLALTLVAGMAAGAPMAAADGLPRGSDWGTAPWTWTGLYGGVHVGNIDSWWDDGLVGGVQLGKNWRSGKIVYGIEGDLSLSGADAIDWLGTLRGRVGYLMSPSILLYGTAGIGFINFNHGGTESELVLGLGVEGKLTESTTVRLEYLNFTDTDADVVRVGLNWKLNWGW